MSLTVDGWSGSIWSVQPWTGMMNTASSVNSCHQSHGVAMAGDSHTPAPGPRCGEQRVSWLWNAGQSGNSKLMLYITMHALQSRWSALLSQGANNVLIFWYRHRLGDRFISTHGCYWAIELRTSTRRLDKSWLYIVFPSSPKWNVLHPCLLQWIDMERY